MEQTTQPTWGHKLGRALGWLAAWAWTVIAGGGGLGLLITRGPLPLTNGWFALLSGISACPLTTWVLKKNPGITIPGWVRFAIAALIIVIGAPGFENRRARHISYRPLTMLERRLLLASSNSQ